PAGDGDPLAGQVGEATQVRLLGDEQPAAVHERHQAEVDLFLPPEAGRGRTALDVHGSPPDHLDTRVGGDGHPAELEVRQPQGLLDGGGNLEAEIDGV